LNEEDDSDDGGGFTPTRSKSPLKSQKIMTSARTAAEPYNLPSASGPGGLVAMLTSLKRIRRDRLRASSPKLEAEAFEEDGHGGQEKSVYFDANSTFPLNETFTTSDDLNNTFKKEQDNRMRSRAEQKAPLLLPSDLEMKIIRQVEYYFGDYNFPKDKWMLNKVTELEDGWFDMETMMTFKRLRSLTEDPSVVLTAVAKSPRGLLQVENWGHGKGRIRRNPDKPCPEYNEARRISMQDRTLFVWGFDRANTSLDDLIEYFEGNFQNVVNIRQRTAPVKEDEDVEEEEEEGMMMEEVESETKKKKQEVKREFLGSIFLTFATRQDAVNFFESNRQSLVFGDQRKLKVKWQKDFFSDRALFNDVFDKETITKTLYISGFDKQDTSESELANFFDQFQGPSAMKKRVYRFASSDNDWRFTGGVFVTFSSQTRAETFFEQYKDNLLYNGDRLRVKWQSHFYQEKGLFKEELERLPKKARTFM